MSTYYYGPALDSELELPARTACCATRRSTGWPGRPAAPAGRAAATALPVDPPEPGSAAAAAPVPADGGGRCRRDHGDPRRLTGRRSRSAKC